ncbi:Geraniol 8-hydroxylase, partial [Mucuna pruriens]
MAKYFLVGHSPIQSMHLTITYILLHGCPHHLNGGTLGECKKGEVLDIGEDVFTTIHNSISTTLFSIDLSNYASEKSHEFRNFFWGIVHELGRHNVADFFPILCPLDPQRVLARSTNYYKLFKVSNEIIEERMSLRASKPDSKLPFLRAVVKETFRLHPPVPLLVPRKCDEMVTISGFMVPKNEQIIVNAWALGRDPTISKDPKIFMPERFLESEIDFKGHDFELIPFGTGKRICPGLSLAHRTMHLIVASLVHNFEWKLADGLMPEHMDMNEQYGITLKRLQPLRVQPIPIKYH